MRPEPQGVDAFIVMMGRDHSWEMPGEKGGRFSHVPLSEAPKSREGLLKERRRRS